MTNLDNSLQCPVMIKSILLRRNEAHTNITINSGGQNAMGANAQGEWLLFTHPVDVVSTSDATKIVDLLNDIESRVEDNLEKFVGFVGGMAAIISSDAPDSMLSFTAFVASNLKV